jgi:hypothetical protein
MQHNLTLVSAFIMGVNKHPTRSIETYLQYGRILMSLKIPKILFIDKDIIDQLGNQLPEYNTIIPYQFNQIYLSSEIERLRNVKVITDSPTKDTIEYMMVQCHKTEWIRQAIQLDIYHTDQYAWIDFGIYQLFAKSADPDVNLKFTDYLYQMGKKIYPLVRLPHIWPLGLRSNRDLYRTICWYFAGGLFGGSKDSLIKFADHMKQSCLHLVEHKSWLMWEVNIWYLIYLDHPEMFDPYYGDHNSTMLANY